MNLEFSHLSLLNNITKLPRKLITEKYFLLLILIKFANAIL